MAESPIPDQALVTVLRPFVRATRPVLDGLRDADPFGPRSRPAPVAGAERSRRERVLDALASVAPPGTAAWAMTDVPARSRWWVRRAGRFTTLLASIPGLGAG